MQPLGRYMLFIYSTEMTLNSRNSVFLYQYIIACFDFPDMAQEGRSSDPYDPPLDLPLTSILTFFVRKTFILDIILKLELCLKVLQAINLARLEIEGVHWFSLDQRVTSKII